MWLTRCSFCSSWSRSRSQSPSHRTMEYLSWKEPLEVTMVSNTTHFYQGIEGQVPMLIERKSVPRAAELLRYFFHHLQSSLFIHLERLWPHQSMVIPWVPPRLAAPRPSHSCVGRWASALAYHCFGTTAPDVTASHLQWQLIRQNCTPLLYKATTPNSLRDNAYLNNTDTRH